jgi:hypothetical protein
LSSKKTPEIGLTFGLENCVMTHDLDGRGLPAVRANSVGAYAHKYGLDMYSEVLRGPHAVARIVFGSPVIE